MLAQLLLFGYLLAWLFGAGHGWLIFLVLVIRLLASRWIALGIVREYRPQLLASSLLAITAGGGLTPRVDYANRITASPLVSAAVYDPLAGMVFANAMTAVSLAAERMDAAREHREAWPQVRLAAYQAAMIPVINALLAVRLVSLSGMMTEKVLSGFSPFVAVRYQIMVMCMIFASAGISTALFLALVRRLIVSTDPDSRALRITTLDTGIADEQSVPADYTATQGAIR